MFHRCFYVQNSMSFANGLRIIAILEASKGALVLLTGFGLLALVHRDIHLAAVKLVQHLHINPASHYPEIFLNLASRVTDIQLWVIAFGAMLYAIVRFIEAIGLWMQRQWAKWFGLLTGGIFIPVELYDVIKGVTWPRVAVLVVNVIIVVYLLFFVMKSKKV
jgi:uncharacterized membrane protein (DUF2068 family)